MSDRNKVIWSEGLFLRPQHFQQQERYFERYVEGRAAGLAPWSWGFEELELDREHLAIGKLAVKRARGVFPDGTPFSIPDHDPAPQPLEVSTDLRARVFLALPLRRAGALDSDRRATADGLARQIVREIELKDVTQEGATTASVEVGGLRTRLIAEGTPTEDFACIPMTYIDGRRSDQVRLDDGFMPTVLRVKACPPLDAFLTEYLGMLTQRLEAFLLIVGSGGRGGGIGEIADFLKLQAIGRYEALVRHFGESASLHPEDFYRWALVIAGDFAALTTEKRRGPVFPPYRHDDLKATFKDVIAALRAYTPDPGPSRAVSIAVELRRPPNYYVARILDSTLIDSAEFILAVRADLPDRQVERTFPQMTTVAPVTRLNELLKGHDPGLTLSSLPQIPPHIPFRTNHVYFEIARNSQLWGDMKGSGAFGLYVPDGFPNLALEMWAIRVR
jgi:type VI secretion system protein ImpJ